MTKNCLFTFQYPCDLRKLLAGYSVQILFHEVLEVAVSKLHGFDLEGHNALLQAGFLGF